MAISGDEHDPPSPSIQSKCTPCKSQTKTIPSPNPKPPPPTNPFAFWFYFTLSVSLITLLFVSFSSLSPSDPKSWFLSLPSSLRQHYSNGLVIKVQTSPNKSPIEVFVLENGPFVSENVVIVHGLGLSSYAFREVVKNLGSKGVRAIAIDLPGSGFSDKSTMETEERGNGVLGRFREVYNMIEEKGFFWAFDQIIETGQIPYEEIQSQASKIKSSKLIELGPEETGIALGQVIETMGLAPIHLVLHDTALSLGANWVAENAGLVRSVTLIDTGFRPALPLWVLELPVTRAVALGFSFAYARLIGLCCSKGIGFSEMEAHRVLLNGKNGRRAVAAMGRKLNHSFDIADWGGLDVIKEMPVQVLWSDDWSKEWSEEGHQVVSALPQAQLVKHSAGRWPQSGTAVELAESIVKFVSALPKTVRQVEEEPLPEHIKKMFDEAKAGDDQHHHHHHGHGGHDGDSHLHTAGYMDAYGLGHGWS